MNWPPLTMRDMMPFGAKHPGKVISWIVANDPAYLCWMREVRLKSRGQFEFLSREVNDALDDVIRASRKTGAKSKLAKRYVLWCHVHEASAQGGCAGESGEHAPETNPETNPESSTRREVVYGDRWGAWA